jgi:hypothetical protein
MECGETKELLSAYLDGEVTEKERKLIESHLASCPSCASELEDLRRVVGLVAALPREAVPEGFVQNTIERLPAPRTPAGEGLRRFFLQPRWAFTSGALAAAALIFVAMSLIYWQGAEVPPFTDLKPEARGRPIAGVAVSAPRDLKGARTERLEEAARGVRLAETAASEELPTPAEAIALAQSFKENILADQSRPPEADRKIEALTRMPRERFARWEKEIAARAEEEHKERYQTQMASNLIANSFVQQKGIAGPQAQYIYLASRDLEKARKELEDILAFAEKNGRLAREETAGAADFRMRGGSVSIRIAPAEVRARISRPGPLPQGFVFTVGLTDEELDRVLEQTIWADNFITTAIEWPTQPAEARRAEGRVAYDAPIEREAALEEMELKEEDRETWYRSGDEVKKPLSQTVLILLEEER